VLNSTLNSSSMRSPPNTSRRLNAEELSKLNDRMSKPKEDAGRGLGPLHPPHTIPKDQLDTSIERMYRHAMDARSRNISNARQRRDESEAPKSVKISPDELDESVRRLYNQSVDRKQRNHEALSDRYLFKLPPISETMERARVMATPNGRNGLRSPSPSRMSRSGSPTSQAEPNRPPSRVELVSRLYTQELEEIEKRKNERYQKYVATTGPRMMKADGDEIGVIVDRLYNSKK